MASNVQGKTIGDIVKYMVAEYSLESCVATSGQTLNMGYLCETATGKKIRLAVAANADSVCLEDLGTLSADTDALFLVRHGIIDADEVDYNSQTKATVDAALKVLGIVPKEQPDTVAG